MDDKPNGGGSGTLGAIALADAGVTAGSVLADHRRGAAVDPEGGALTMTRFFAGLRGWVDAGSTVDYGNGILTIAADGTCSFDPGEAYLALGDDEIASLGTLSVQVADAGGQSHTFSFSAGAWHVVGQNFAPDVQDRADVVQAGQVVTALLSDAATALEGDEAITALDGQAFVGGWVTLPGGGAVQLVAGGTALRLVTGEDFLALDDGESATLTLPFTVTDAGGLTDQGVWTVTVQGVDDDPTGGGSGTPAQVFFDKVDGGSANLFDD